MFSAESRTLTGRPTLRSAAMLGILGLISAGIFVGHAPSAYATSECSSGDATTYAGGDGSSGDPYQISTAQELILLSDKSNDGTTVHSYLGVHFKQTALINLGDCDFTPIGPIGNPFEGTYDGDSFDIEGLLVDEDEGGLFARLADGGTITRVSIKGGSVSGVTFGALVAINFGMISNSSSSASVEGNTKDAETAGGLVGENRSGASIENSSATGMVVFDDDDTEARRVGGFVGENEGEITGSTATGDADLGVRGRKNDAAGGFVGLNASGGLISDSQASGDATSEQNNAGGFAGINEGTIEDSSALGAVVADNDQAGGFAGFNSEGAEITDSHSIGGVTGDSEVGGFVGENEGTITGSYATGRVIAGDTEAGGFVGYNDDSGEISDSHATGRVSGNDEVGGFVGENKGTITGSYATGQVNALLLEDPEENDGGFRAGGFAGLNDGTISNSYATGSVETVNDLGGGFVGDNSGTISGSSASGNATAANAAGGFVGENGGTISDSSASGNATATTNRSGGFAGRNSSDGTIRDSSATGNATADERSGGFVGSNGGAVATSYATGDATSSTDKAGGFVGDNGERGNISDSYATGNAEASVEEAGGFAGDSSGTISSSYSTGTATAPLGVGGFLGKDEGTTVDSFWNITTSGLILSAGLATGITTAQMSERATFANIATAGLVTAWEIIDGWEASDSDPDNVWGICSQANDGFPFLLWEYSGNPCAVSESGGGNTRQNNDDDSVTPVATAAPSITAVRPRTAEAASPQPVGGPVLRGGVVAELPRVPTVLVGGVPTVVRESYPNPTTLSVVAGSLSVRVSVDEGSGEVLRLDEGVTRLKIKSDSAALLQGSGLQPGASVQVFILLSVDDSRELTMITVATNGSFSGALPLATDPLAEPLPIGEKLLQLVSIDAEGNQVVLEMAVDIAQGDPAPALDREAGEIPVVMLGSTTVTSAGVVMQAKTTALPDQGLAVVEGDGWNMAVSIGSGQGAVEPTESGALVTMVREETAQVSGVGFMAGTRADVWLFSQPVLLGTVTVDENGEFSGGVSINPDLISTGEHTLQLQGVGTDGYIKAVNMGVFVDDGQPERTTAERAGFDLGFIWWILAIIVFVAVLMALWLRRRQRE